MATTTCAQPLETVHEQANQNGGPKNPSVHFKLSSVLSSSCCINQQQCSSEIKATTTTTTMIVMNAKCHYQILGFIFFFFIYYNNNNNKFSSSSHSFLILHSMKESSLSSQSLPHCICLRHHPQKQQRPSNNQQITKNRYEIYTNAGEESDRVTFSHVAAGTIGPDVHVDLA